MPGDQPSEGEELPDQTLDDSRDGKPGDQDGEEKVENWPNGKPKLRYSVNAEGKKDGAYTEYAEDGTPLPVIAAVNGMAARLRGRKGQNTVEYLMMLAVIVGVILVVGKMFKPQISQIFNQIMAMISGAASSVASGN